jgi:hypothetical protein
LEKYLADQGSLESGFLHLGGSVREDAYLGQSKKVAYHCN